MLKTRKLIALVLSMASLLACMMPAMASDSSGGDHEHDYEIVYSEWELVGGGAQGCRYRASAINQCTICGDFIPLADVVYKYEPHDYYAASATCNGRMQTHRYICRICDYVDIRSMTCPAGPHTGACPALPFRVGELIK